MKLTIQLVPIPPPDHPDSVPDPPTVFHYTTGLKLDLILRSGSILPTTAKVPPHEKPVAWFSTSPTWEPTATKVPILGKLGQLATARAQQGLVRIQVPASAVPHRIQDLPRLAGTSPDDWLGLVVSGLELGADPTTWRFTLSPVSVPPLPRGRVPRPRDRPLARRRPRAAGVPQLTSHYSNPPPP